MTGITVTVADLAGAADNSEFLPTADPNVWMAKAGSAAYGKLHASAFW